MKRTLFVAIAAFAVVGLMRADDLEDSYAKLKEAVTAKNADTVKTEAANVHKLAEALVNAPQPSAADLVENWKQRAEYGKEVVAYTEYALSTTAAQSTDPAKTVELVNELLAQNPKSKYLDIACTQAYLNALGKSGTAKQIEGMSKVIAGSPDNEVALDALAQGLANRSPDRALGYANKLVAVLKTKAKPEGIPEAEWEKTKSTWLATGYYLAGAIYGGKSQWIECDREMKAALPMIHDNSRLSVVYFYLGLSNYQLGKMTMDRPRIQSALKYSQQAAGIAGPMKDQASHNVTAIQNELQGRK